MPSDELTKCVACAEEIKAEALLCKFCQTRQDDPNFTKTLDEPKSSKAAGWNFKVAIIVIVVLTALSSLSYTLLAQSREGTARQIEESIKQQVYKMAILELMGDLKKVKCSPQGVTIVLLTTDYKCLAQDETGGGLAFKATMDWQTGIYRYGLDRE